MVISGHHRPLYEEHTLCMVYCALRSFLFYIQRIYQVFKYIVALILCYGHLLHGLNFNHHLLFDLQ